MSYMFIHLRWFVVGYYTTGMCKLLNSVWIWLTLILQGPKILQSITLEPFLALLSSISLPDFLAVLIFNCALIKVQEISNPVTWSLFGNFFKKQLQVTGLGLSTILPVGIQLGSIEWRKIMQTYLIHLKGNEE